MLPLLSIAYGLAPMAIQVADPDGEPVPCVTLTTVHKVTHTTDDAGLIAFLEPGLVGQDVWFHIEADGYGVPTDLFGYAGAAVRIADGGFHRIEVDRTGPPGPCPSSNQHQRLLEAGLPSSPMRVEVIDPDTGRGVPLARVHGTSGSADRTWVTDSAGNVAVIDPVLYGQDLDITVEAWRGYGPSATTTTTISEGGHLVLEAPRELPGERLYRLTGADPYRDTELLGLPTPVPPLQGQVVGQDSNLSATLNGRLLWLYGDTLKPSYPLGHFDMAGAVIADPTDADAGQPIGYFVDANGFSRGVADLSDDGPVWVTAPAVFDEGGTQVMVAVFGVYAGLSLTDRGMAQYDETTDQFVPLGPLPLSPPIGHQTAVTTQGHVWMREGLRYPATIAAAADISTWQVWTPVVDDVIVRDVDGEAEWAWRTDVQIPDSERLSRSDRWSDPRDPNSGERVAMHEGSVVYSPYRRRYLHVFSRNAGISQLGEQWISEADQPHGPWRFARPYAHHDGYTTYNPMPNPQLGADDGDLYVQSTYTTFFATETNPTPRYDYNQLMYRLDLDHPELAMPTPVYVTPDGDVGTLHHMTPDSTPAQLRFHAPDRPGDDLVAIGLTGPSCAGGVWAADGKETRFWARTTQGPGLVPLHHITQVDGTTTVDVDVPADGTADPTPLGWVWPHDAAPVSLDAGALPSHRIELGPDRCVPNLSPLTLDALAAGVELVGGVFEWWVDGVSAGNASTLDVQPSTTPSRIELRWTSERGSVVFDVLWVQGTDPETTTSTPTTENTDPTEPTDPVGSTDADAKTEAGCGCAAPSKVSMGAFFTLLSRR